MPISGHLTYQPLTGHLRLGLDILRLASRAVNYSSLQCTQKTISLSILGKVFPEILFEEYFLKIRNFVGN